MVLHVEETLKTSIQKNLSKSQKFARKEFFVGQSWAEFLGRISWAEIFIAAETKINESFPTAQFAIDGFHKPLRLDATDKSGCLLVRSYLPLRVS